MDWIHPWIGLDWIGLGEKTPFFKLVITAAHMYTAIRDYTFGGYFPGHLGPLRL